MESSDPRTLLIAIASTLEREGIPYLITGGMAVVVWGRPRFTADIDMVVELSPKKIPSLFKALSSLREAGYLDEEMMKEAVAHQGEFNFIDPTTGMKIDFWVSQDDPFDRSRISRRKPKTVLGHTIYFSSPEDLILSKFAWYKASRSTRHLEDIQSILAISGKMLDKSYLHEWIDRLEFQSFAAQFSF